METSIPNVVVTRDGGHPCWDTTVTAREIQKMLVGGILRYDPAHQRGARPGKADVTGLNWTERAHWPKLMIDVPKVDRWAQELQADTAIFGQLAWNFRPEDAEQIRFEAAAPNGLHGRLVIEDGQGTLPDSAHRHLAIKEAVDSFSRGSDFDPSRRFSLRIWSVPEAFEDVIFNAMNTEQKKADSSRSKWLHQRGTGQLLAAELVRNSPWLGADNVQTVVNTVSVRDHRLAAFNTFSSAFEEVWGDIPQDQTAAAVTWLVKYWDELVGNIPQLRKLPLSERQAARMESLAGSAIAIHGYVRLARKLYPDGDLAVLGSLGEPGFLQIDNPELQARGIVVPGSGRSAGKLVVRSSHASRRSMGELLAEWCGIA